MDGDSGGSGSIGDAGGIGGIGAGGGKDKGKNIPNELKREAEARRKAEQDRPRENVLPPLREFEDGCKLIEDWCQSHPTLLSEIVNQKTDICWALVLARILQFVYNKDREVNQHKFLDIDSFVRKVKLTEDEVMANKKLDPKAMSVGTLKKAMDHIFSKGIEKQRDGRPSRKGSQKSFTIKGVFLTQKNATPMDIVELLKTKGPVGITIDVGSLRAHKEGIYRVPMPQAGQERHALMIVAYGETKDREVFFDVQNTWGTDWGVNGHGRIMITGTTDDVFYLDEVIKEKKKKKNN